MVDIQGMALDERLTATVAMGLLNRRFHKPTVVGNITVTDRLWLDTLQSQESPLASLTFKNISGWELAELAVYTGAAVGRIAYDPQEAWSFSTVVTLCGIHRAIPVPMQRHNITTLDSPAAPSMQPYRRLPQLQDSDGDNMQMEFNGNRDRMEERFAACGTPEARAVHACPPISWTFSNRLLTFAPFIVQWWFSRAQATGLDSYLMGPSGYGFLHPSQMAPGDIQTALLVNNTVQAATEMAMEGFVHWDDYGNGLQQAAPHEDAGHGAESTEVEKVAKIMNDQPLGSLSYIYKIIDVEYSHVEAVLGLLGPHVQLVGYRELTALARQKREMGL
ncbi:hypothetical protein WJX72_007634 [[Myrmecia] bisecta]|uniref:GxGYxYP putative glycoside hydrolase C-terminal domain-containing protein n=1 Tax=[Myrmecia] bisecta TaxID=41462 RepID=A0AAW1PXA7_9CHLO